MYASLIAAGASQLYDLYKSVSSSSSKSTSSPSFDTETDSKSTGAVNSTSSSGSSFSSALQKLFVDLQASTSGTATSPDPTSTIANDLQSAFHDVKASGAHGRHHSGPPAGPSPDDDSQSASSDLSSTSSSTSTSTRANPFRDLASSLLAYTKTQSLSASSSTSLTA